MNFYESISSVYDKIFPPNHAQVDFVVESLTNAPRSSLLEIGCGTGNLSYELSKKFQDITAIDLDEAMLKKAEEKHGNSVRLMKLNMLSIEDKFGQDAFDGIVCFGNTLVHLENSESILNFLKQARTVLKKNGKLLFQIINYDRIISENITSLPTIDNEEIRFVRNYNLNSDQNELDFETTLTVKKTGDVIENTIKLFPIQNFELINLLNRAGFQNVFFFNNFKKSIFAPQSVPLIVEAY